MNRSEWLLVLGITVLSFLMMALVSQEPIEAAKAAISATRLASGGLAQGPTVAPTPLQTALPISPPPTITPRPTTRPTATATTVPTPTATPFPFDAHPELDRYIYVDQLSQHMYIFRHGELFRTIPCSTGLPTSTTYTEAWEGPVGHFYGTFQSFGVYADLAWYLYPSLGSILVHSLPYNYENGAKVYEDWEHLGVRPSSHGCIRISPEDAEWFTEWNPEGVLMTITDPYLEYWQALEN